MGIANKGEEQDFWINLLRSKIFLMGKFLLQRKEISKFIFQFTVLKGSIYQVVEHESKSCLGDPKPDSKRVFSLTYELLARTD